MNCLVLNPIKHLNLYQIKAKIIISLSEIGIISDRIIKDDENNYLAGENYLHYISFIGCSPYLNFTPKTKVVTSDLNQTIADLNYIQMDFNNESYCFRKTDFGVKAICPACKSRIPEWNKLIQNWENNLKLNLACTQCHTDISILDIDWKKTAGLYKSAILFHGIQAELALPTDALLKQLELTTNVKWQHFYGK